MPVVRLGTDSDVLAAVGIWNDAARAHDPRFTLSDRFERSIRLAACSSTLLIADDRADSVGMMTFGQARAEGGAGVPVEGLAHIGLVAVSPTHWGRGIGKMLMQSGIDKIRSADYTSVQLWVRDDNTRASRLYKSLGFRVTDDAMTNDLGWTMHRYVVDL